MLNEAKILRDKIEKFRLLNEWVSRNDVIESIQKRHVIYIYYSGDDTVNKGYRTIEPYTLGVHKNTGNLVLRAWQQAGASDTPTPNPKNDGIAGWRMFRLDGITSYVDTQKVFPKQKDNWRQGYVPYKTPVDKHMSAIIATVQMKDIESDDISKSDIENKMNKMSIFDPQAKKFNKFYQSDANQEAIKNQKISDLYHIIKQRKENPSDFIVYQRDDGSLWYKKKNTAGSIPQDRVVGDLNNLFRQASGLKKFKVDKSFVEKQRRDFIDKVEKSLEQ